MPRVVLEPVLPLGEALNKKLWAKSGRCLGDAWAITVFTVGLLQRLEKW